MREIWGVGTPRSFRPIWVCEELGLDYQHHAIGPRTGETQQPAFTELNRKQKIPFYRDSDVSLSESVAICRYLAHQSDGATLYVPDTKQSVAKEDEWCAYIYGEIDETGLYVMRRHGDLGAIYGESPEVVSAAADYVARHLSVVASHFGERETLMSGGFGLADIMLMSCLDWCIAYGVALPAEIQHYYAIHAARPAYGRAMRINYPDLFEGDA